MGPATNTTLRFKRLVKPDSRVTRLRASIEDLETDAVMDEIWDGRRPVSPTTAARTETELRLRSDRSGDYRETGVR
ncbi:hypothetical protein NJ7G_0256 [Natrinema sp. J7-2]|nr:hypothetical protein NJ7G_0256 [Natrinema sp. J7-2]